MSEPTERDMERVAIEAINKALHFWAPDWWDFKCMTDHDWTDNTDAWFGTVVATPRLGGQPSAREETFFLSIHPDNLDTVEFELAEDMFAEVSSENIYMYLYFNLAHLSKAKGGEE